MLITFEKKFYTMKKLLFLLAISGAILACNSQSEKHEKDSESMDSNQTIDEEVLPDTGHFGASFTAENMLDMAGMEEAFAGQDSMTAIVSGEVSEVCQKKGCWITLERSNGEMMRVKTMDQFFLPKNCSGKTAIIDGVVKRVVTPVEELQHYAKDAGKSEEEIAAITEDKHSIEMIASGIIIQ